MNETGDGAAARRGEDYRSISTARGEKAPGVIADVAGAQRRRLARNSDV